MFQNIQSSSPKSAAANLESSQSPRPADFDASSAVFLPLSPSMLRTNQKLSDKSRPATASAATQNINNNEPQRGNNTNPFIIDMYSLPNFFGFPSTIGMMKQEHPLEAASGDLRSTTPSPLPPPQQANKPKGSSQGKSNDERKRQQVVEYGIIDDKKNDKDDGILLAASPLSSTPVSPLEMKRDKRKARAKSAGPNSSSESA